jgi:outer membrane lipopolysaccharide assembly protein LptE/RlpB
MRRRQLLGALLAIAGTSSLAGCSGWYLRGTRKNVLGDVKRIFVSTPTRNLLYSYFITEMSYINVSIVSDRSQADVIVELAEERYERRELSVDPDTGKVREVEVTLSTRIAVRGKDGSLVSAPETFRWTEDFVFDEGSLLGTVEVEQNLRVEMAKAAGRALVLKLETIDFTRQGKNAG